MDPKVWLSFAAMRAADVLQAFPVFVFAIALVAALGQSIQTVVLAIAFVNMPIYLRLVRSQVLSIRAMRYVEAAKVAGVSDITTIRRHVIPNAIAPVLAQLSVNVGWGILLTAALSFVGAGVRAPTPEWGSMIAMGFQNVVTGQWWPSVFPGLSLAITVFGFSLVGASIETLSDPANRQTLAQEMEARNARAAGPSSHQSGNLNRCVLSVTCSIVSCSSCRSCSVSCSLASSWLRSIPGDPAVLMLGPTATPDAIASLRTQMGLDQPLYMQFYPLCDSSVAWRPRHFLADHAAGPRRFDPALSCDAGAGDLSR